MRDSVPKIPVYVLAALAFLVGFGATAFAADAAAPSDGSLLDLLRPAYDLLLSGHYAAGSAAVLVLAVALARRYGAPRWAFLGSDLGGALLTLVGSFGAALGASLATSALTPAVAEQALKVAVMAAGGYSLANKLLTALEGWSRLPAWLRPVLRIVTWIFDEVDGGAAAIAHAEVAGAAAVAAAPGKGPEGPLGSATELK